MKNPLFYYFLENVNHNHNWFTAQMFRKEMIQTNAKYKSSKIV